MSTPDDTTVTLALERAQRYAQRILDGDARAVERALLAAREADNAAMNVRVAAEDAELRRLYAEGNTKEWERIINARSAGRVGVRTYRTGH